MKITYIYHSGFVVELDKHILVFDYYKGDLPPFDKPVYYFVSHFHQDHFNREILQFPGTFILSKDTRVKEDEHIHIVKKNQIYTIDDFVVETLRSTDAGVAYIVTIEDHVIYHGGDLNWWHWKDDSKEGIQHNNNMRYLYQREMNKLDGRHFDVAMVPVDPRLQEYAYLGLEELLKHVTIDDIFPMHFSSDPDKIMNDPKCNIHIIKERNQSFIL